MAVRPMRPDDAATVLAQMRELWPDEDVDEVTETVLVWRREDDTPGGFVQLAIRPWADGCRTAPVPYVEGWFVAEDLRRQGVGRALMAAAEDWARERGFTELGSDALAENVVSIEAHERLGFERTELIQHLRKDLGPAE